MLVASPLSVEDVALPSLVAVLEAPPVPVLVLSAAFANAVSVIGMKALTHH
jgi:hypothetical protein